MPVIATNMVKGQCRRANILFFAFVRSTSWTTIVAKVTTGRHCAIMFRFSRISLPCLEVQALFWLNPAKDRTSRAVSLSGKGGKPGTVVTNRIEALPDLMNSKMTQNGSRPGDPKTSICNLDSMNLPTRPTRPHPLGLWTRSSGSGIMSAVGL